MADLTEAVAKTVNVVFADIKSSSSDKKKRINSIKGNIGKVANIPLNEIQTKENIRKYIDVTSEGFLRLVESIKRYGVLENIVVELRVNDDGTDYQLICIAGHRRILAARAAKNIEKVPCLLQCYERKGDGIGAALAENLNREDLHCIDVAEGYRELIRSGWVEEDLAQHFCRDIRTIRHYLKIADWPKDSKELLRSHPSIFSTRVIMRRFAYKKQLTPNELKASIKGLVIARERTDGRVEKKTPALKSPGSIGDKAAMAASLDLYLAKQIYLSEIIKEEIKRAFVELGVI